MQARKKNEGFRHSIRREQIESYFAQQRQLLMQEQGKAQNYELINELKNSAVKQKEFIEEVALALTGQPKEEWLEVISNLQIAVVAFDGNFEPLLTSGIVSSLMRIIKQPHLLQGLTAKICSLFSDMVYLAFKFESNFPERLMQYEFFDTLILSGMNKDLSIEGRTYILRFCSNLCLYSTEYRKQFLRNGGGIWVDQLGEQIIRCLQIDEKIVHNYLISVTGVIALNKKLKKFEINRLIPIFGTLLIRQQYSDRIVTSCLNNIGELLKYDRESIITNVYNFHGVIPKIIALVNNNSAEVRRLTLYVVCTLAYTNQTKILADLVSRDVLDELFKVYTTRGPIQSAAYCRLTLCTLSNIASSSKNLAQTIFQHSVFQIIINLLQASEFSTRKEAFSCLYTIVLHLRFNNLSKLIHDYNILYDIIRGFNEMKTIDSDTTIEILKMIATLYQSSQKVYRKNENPVVGQLQNIYHFTHLLEDLLNTTKHQLLRSIADHLHQKLSENTWDDTLTL